MDSAWKLYEVHAAELDELRPIILVRALVVDSQPFEEIMESSFGSGIPWQTR